MAPPAWAYQVDNFDPVPDEELICSICRAIFCEPVQCPCNHVFCRTCISEWLRRNRNCPICRKRATRATIQEVVPLVRNMIFKLTLRCRNSEQGCSEKFTLEGCENHMKSCMFEMIQCKNKPCKLKMFRKDIEDHELNGCPHRSLKCVVCKLKISTADPGNHNCIIDLKKLLRRKVLLLRKKRERIRELQAEVKRLKEASEFNSDTSSSSSSSSDIMISLADFHTDSSGTEDTDSMFSGSAGNESDDDGDGVQSSSDARDNSASQELGDFGLFLELLGSPYMQRNESDIVPEVSQFDESESVEHPRASTPAGEDNVAEELPTASANYDCSSPVRRPAKRRHRNSYLSTDEEDNADPGVSHSLLPSPKRSWRVYRFGEGSEASPHAVSENSSTSSQISNSFSDAGPSFSNELHPTASGSARSSKSRFNLRPRSSLKQPKKETEQQNNAAGPSGTTFDRTLALLEQYNLDSDPEWLPEFSGHVEGTSESELSASSEPTYFLSSDESSESELDTSDSYEDVPEGNAFVFRSNEDSDPDWFPNEAESD